MAAPRISRVIFILACINCIHGQYFDFFQALQPYFQPPPTQFNVYNEYTTRRPRPKQKPTDTRNDNRKVAVPVEHTDKRRKPTTPNDSTTQKPIRKTTKAQHNSNRNTKVTNTRVSPVKVTNNDGAVYFEDRPNRGGSRTETESRPVSVKDSSSRNDKKNLNQPLIAYDTDGNFDNGRNSYYFTTKPPFDTTKYQNNKDKNYYTTHNPVNPVRPLGPPITNKPVTQRPDEPIEDASPEIITGPDEDYMSAVEKKRHIDVAERMCEKYKSLNVKKVEAIPLVPSPQPVTINVTTCPPTNVPLVVGGKVVTIQEFPHMALLGWKRVKNRGYSWKCGGSLLSNQYVLTAGHCGYQDRDDYVIAGPPRVVQLGSSFLDDPKATIVKISAVIRHPKYKQPKSYYDLAIVKMATPVSFSETIKPACLGVPPRANEPIIATGWGKTEFGGGLSRELRSVSIPVWDLTECHNALGTSIKIPYGPSSESQICAGEKSGGKDTCQGDSGGPAQMQDGCSWRVVAVTSVGRSCGAADTPAIYAIVQRPFISAVVFGNQASDNRNIETNENNKLNQENNNRNDEYNNNRAQTNNNRAQTNNNRNTQVTNINRDGNRGQTNTDKRNDNINQQTNNNRNDNWNNQQSGFVTNQQTGNDKNNRNQQTNNNRNDNWNNQQTGFVANQQTSNNNNKDQQTTNNNRNDNWNNQQPGFVNQQNNNDKNNRNQQTGFVANQQNTNNNRNQQTTNGNRNDNWSNQQPDFVANQQTNTNNNRNQQTNNNRNDNWNTQQPGFATTTNRNPQTSNNRNDNNWNKQTTFVTNQQSNTNNNNKNQQTTNNNWNNQQPGITNQQSNFNTQTNSNPRLPTTGIENNWNNQNQRVDNNNYNQNQPFGFNNYNYNTPDYSSGQNGAYVPRGSDYFNNYNYRPYNDGRPVYNGGNVWWTK